MSKIDAWITKIPRLKNAKVSRFSYKDAAYTNDDIEGVENYDYTRDMNVPSLNKTDTEASVLDSGARAQFSSLSKNALNHFFGRVSYNLNKVIDFLSDFLDDFRVQGVETVASSVAITLDAYYSGKKLRLVNTHATDSILFTFYAGQTFQGSNTVSIPAGRVIDIELFETTWKDSLTGNLVGSLTGNASTASKANVRVSLRHGNTWFAKTWTGLTDFNSNNIWTDGENIYCSNGINQYVLNKATSTWTAKTWTGLTDFSGNNIWTDGENIYHSNGTNQYVLNKATSTWAAKTWTGLTDFSGNNIWTDGDNIYYSEGTKQYVLNKATSKWTAKTWTGLTDFRGDRIWTNGENIYYSDEATQRILNKAASSWTSKTWTGSTYIRRDRIWTNGENIYLSDGTYQYVLNKATSTWTAKTWTTNFYGNYIWTDGDNIYYSNRTNHYVLPATRHNYVDDNKYNSLFGIVTSCNCSTLSDRFVFRNE
jgi:hypothetical protein